MNDENLLAALEQAEHDNMHARECLVCVALGEMSETARSHVERALAGTIGMKKLAKILTENGYEASERAVGNHRREGHSA